MPTLKIQTNAQIPAAERKRILEAASAKVAKILGKPESYVMVMLQANPDMLFAGDEAPLAYLELTSLGLPDNATPDISAALCGFMEEHFGVSPGRTYINFASPPRHMFGWSGRTF